MSKRVFKQSIFDQMFKVFDKDNDGRISSNDFCETMTNNQIQDFY